MGCTTRECRRPQDRAQGKRGQGSQIHFRLLPHPYPTGAGHTRRGAVAGGAAQGTRVPCRALCGQRCGSAQYHDRKARNSAIHSFVEQVNQEVEVDLSSLPPVSLSAIFRPAAFPRGASDPGSDRNLRYFENRLEITFLVRRDTVTLIRPSGSPN